jgi:hypothetical protein
LPSERGDPNGGDRATWPRWAPATDPDPELVFDLEIKTEQGRRNERCDFWTQLGLPE